jgi:hypothetical protein
VNRTEESSEGALTISMADFGLDVRLRSGQQIELDRLAWYQSRVRRQPKSLADLAAQQVRFCCGKVKIEVATDKLAGYLPKTLILKTLCYVDPLQVHVTTMSGQPLTTKQIKNSEENGGGFITAHLLQPVTDYMLVLSTTEPKSRKDKWNMAIMEDPYGGDSSCPLDEEGHQSGVDVGPAILVVETPRKVYMACDPEHAIEITGKYEEFIFHLSNEVAGCDFCDVSFLKLWWEKPNSAGWWCLEDKEYKKTIAFMLTNDLNE